MNALKNIWTLGTEKDLALRSTGWVPQTRMAS